MTNVCTESDKRMEWEGGLHRRSVVSKERWCLQNRTTATTALVIDRRHQQRPQLPVPQPRARLTLRERGEIAAAPKP